MTADDSVIQGNETIFNTIGVRWGLRRQRDHTYAVHSFMRSMPCSILNSGLHIGNNFPRRPSRAISSQKCTLEGQTTKRTSKNFKKYSRRGTMPFSFGFCALFYVQLIARSATASDRIFGFIIILFCSGHKIFLLHCAAVHRI